MGSTGGFEYGVPHCDYGHLVVKKRGDVDRIVGDTKGGGFHHFNIWKKTKKIDEESQLITNPEFQKP